MAKQYYKKDELSFRDIWFRIPGLVICLLSGVGEFYLRIIGTNSDAKVLGQDLPAFIFISAVGLAMFSAPYLELAWNKYKSYKNQKAINRDRMIQKQEELEEENELEVQGEDDNGTEE